MLQVLAEILPNIQVCNIYVTLPFTEKCQKLHISKSEFVLEFVGGTVVTIDLPRGTYLVPKETTNVNQDGNTLSVRAQMDENSSLIGVLCAELLGDATTIFVDEPLHDRMVEQKISAHCKKCHHVVQPDVTFRRVLPLPSVDWDQASEDWFCHLHDEDSKKLKPSSLIPSHDECFYSELFFLLNCSALNSMAIDCNDENSLMCKGCGESLGEKANPSLKLWTQNIKWLHDNGNVLFSRSLENILHSLFENIDKDNFGVNCRLVLAVTVPKMYLYMVTMNINQKLLLSESNQTDDELDELDDQNDLHNKRSRCGDSSNIKLKKLFAIKLLYQIKEGDDDQTGSWQDDVNVHILPCSMSFLSEVRLLLEMSSTLLPSEMRIFESMNVGYIMKS